MDFLGKNFVTHIEEGKSKISAYCSMVYLQEFLPMASISLNAYQNRVASGLFLGVLQQILAMCRKPLVIMIARGN